MGVKLFSAIILLFLISPVFTLGQEGSDLPNPGLTPDSPLYVLDTLGERLGLFLTFSAEGKAKKALGYAE